MTDTTAAYIKAIAEILLGIGGLSGLVATLLGRKKSMAEAEQIESQTEREIPAKAAASLVASSGDVVQLYRDLLAQYQTDTDKKIKVMQGEIKNLEGVLEKYAKRLVYLMNGIQELIEQINDFGEKPCWTPNDDWKPETKQSGDQTHTTKG